MRRISETVLVAAYAGTGEDAHGNEVETWGAPAAVGIYAFNPASSSEVFIDGHMHRVESQPTIYLPSASIIGPRDRVTARGVLYTVDGVTGDFRNPFNESMDGLQVALKVVTG